MEEEEEEETEEMLLICCTFPGVIDPRLCRFPRQIPEAEEDEAG